MEFKGTKGKWTHKKGKRSKWEYDNFVLDENGNHILKWGNTGIGSYKMTIKESQANGLLISKAPEMLEFIKSIVDDYENGLIEDIEHVAIRAELLYQQATEL